MTTVERVFSEKVGERVEEGDFVEVEPDVIMIHDGSGATALRVMRDELGVERVEDPDKVVLVFDHSVPPSSVEAADRQNELLRFAEEHGISKVHVDEGVCHQILVEKGYASGGRLVFGGDSHTPTCGAVGAVGIGFGGTDMAFAMMYGELWVRVPPTIEVRIVGRPRFPSTAKDVALRMVSEIGAGGAEYRALEFTGSVSGWELGDRMTLCNLATEVGAKTAVVSGEEVVEGAERRVEIDARHVEPCVSRPGRVDDVVPVSEVEGVEVTRVFVGSCTNGRYEDMALFAGVLEEMGGPCEHVRIVVVPASRTELLKAVKDGVVERLVRMGVLVCPPGCGPCLGEHMGVLGRDDVCVATSNRNFPGRMGHRDAEIYLASPVTAAVAAAEGELKDPRDVLGG